VFDWSPELTLTSPGSPGLTAWRLPGCFHPAAGTVLTYHRDPRLWADPDPDPDGAVAVARRGRGQEFVCEASSDVLDWALGVIGRGSGPRRWSAGGSGPARAASPAAL
jgi:hypothetical protein